MNNQTTANKIVEKIKWQKQKQITKFGKMIQEVGSQGISNTF